MEIEKLKCRSCDKKFYVKDNRYDRYDLQEDNGNVYIYCLQCVRDYRLRHNGYSSITDHEIYKFWKKSKKNFVIYRIQKLEEENRRLNLRIDELEKNF